MSATARTAPRTNSSPSEAIVQPGKNCWRVDRADRFLCIQDAADYFALVRQALLAARKTVFILGWDIFAGVDLLPAGPKGPPTRLDELLSYIARRRPKLRCYILIWDYAALYTLERDPWSRWRLGWRTHRHVHFGFDDRHPVGGSHHQKIVVVDDALAFCGGIDLTSHRWDTSAHRVDEPARLNSAGKPYGPYHEVQAMVSGPAAASFGQLARDRWRALGEKMPALDTAPDAIWPDEAVADLTDVDVAIARTMPASETQPAVRECETLFLDSIARARHAIYMESQYFTNDVLGDALAARLRERDGPEIVVVSPTECDGWLERNTMGTFRAAIFRRLIAADTYKRLRIVYPIASRTQQVPTFVHSKVMVIDDELVRVGSANFSRRSMGVDTECDVAVDAGGNARTRDGIRRIRDRLVAEHLGLTVDAVARGIDRAGSLGAFVDSRQGAEHTLVRIELPPEDEPPSEAARSIADPDEPIAFGSTMEQLVPPADATNGLRPLPFPAVPTLVLAIALASIIPAVSESPQFQTLQHGLASIPGTPVVLWLTAGAVALAGLVMVPLELLAIVTGVVFGLLRGSVVALLGSLAAAAIGYAAGRSIGPSGLPRWMSRRSYRSARQLGARGVLGVLILRLASVATSGSIHLLCGAGRVPFAAYMAGTLAAFVPAVVALSALGTLLRDAVLVPTMSHGLAAAGVAVLLTAGGAILRTLLLIRQFAPSLSRQRARAEFG